MNVVAGEWHDCFLGQLVCILNPLFVSWIVRVVGIRDAMGDTEGIVCSFCQRPHNPSHLGVDVIQVVVSHDAFPDAVGNPDTLVMRNPFLVGAEVHSSRMEQCVQVMANEPSSDAELLPKLLLVSKLIEYVEGKVGDDGWCDVGLDIDRTNDGNTVPDVRLHLGLEESNAVKLGLFENVGCNVNCSRKAQPYVVVPRSVRRSGSDDGTFEVSHGYYPFCFRLYLHVVLRAVRDVSREAESTLCLQVGHHDDRTCRMGRALALHTPGKTAFWRCQWIVNDGGIG